MTYRLVPHGRGRALEVSLDRAWLDDAARAWPVTVDRSYYITQSDHDTFVQHPYVADYSWWGELKVGTFNGGGDKARSFLRFPALDALDGKVIHSAQAQAVQLPLLHVLAHRDPGVPSHPGLGRHHHEDLPGSQLP